MGATICYLFLKFANPHISKSGSFSENLAASLPLAAIHSRPIGRLTLPEFQNTGWPTEAIEVLAGSGLLQLLPPRLIRSMGLKVLFPVSKKELMSMSSTLVWSLPMSTLFLKRKEEQKIEKGGREIRSFSFRG